MNSSGMRRRLKHFWIGFLTVLGAGFVLLAALVASRAFLLGLLANTYFAGQGIPSSIVVESANRREIVAHGWIGSAQELSTERLVIKLMPDGFVPQITEVQALHPKLHLSVDRAGVSVGSLQNWLETLVKAPARPAEKSRLISDRVKVQIDGAELFVKSPAGMLHIEMNLLSEGATLKNGYARLGHVRLSYNSIVADIRSVVARLAHTRQGIGFELQTAGSLQTLQHETSIQIEGWRAWVDVPELQWHDHPGAPGASVRSATLYFDSAHASARGSSPLPPSFKLVLKNFDIAFNNGHVLSQGSLSAIAGGSLSQADAVELIDILPMIKSDPRIANSLARSLQSLKLTGKFSWHSSDRAVAVTIISPFELTGANRSALRMSTIPGTDLHIAPDGVEGSLVADLTGSPLPKSTITLSAFSWKSAPASLDSQIDLGLQFDFGALRGVSAAGEAEIHTKRGAFELTLTKCAATQASRFDLQSKPFIKDGTMYLCPSPGRPLFKITPQGWSFDANTRHVGAIMPHAAIAFSQGSATVHAAGDRALKNAAASFSARLTDRAKRPRFGPLMLQGMTGLDGTNLHGSLSFAAGSQYRRLGTLKFSHSFRSVIGRATISCPNILFALDGLQPRDLSPIFAAVSHAQGSTQFNGRFDWTPKHMTSEGALDMDDLHFTSPLGVANHLSTHIKLTSLLPPETAPNQELAISRIDWISPLLDFDSRLSFDAKQIRILGAKTSLTGGRISLTPLTVTLAPSLSTRSAARLEHIDLGSLIQTSNLAGKIKFEGKITGTLPFSLGPEGFRITEGRLSADSAGRLAIDPSLWGQAVPNAIESFAYRALQNLAFDSLSATADSEPQGRLRIVFHIKGHSETPGSPDVNVFDLIRGTAFQKSIPLPTGTPVDLTLDTSLNFDELLRGYETAWAQATAAPAVGGKP